MTSLMPNDVEVQEAPIACRFYQRQGCSLRDVNFGAYPELPDEVQLIWAKPLWPET